MLDAFIFVTVMASLLIVLGKAAWAISRLMQLIGKHGIFKGVAFTLIDADFWIRMVNFAADFVISTFLAVGVRLLITTRISAAIIGCITIIVSGIIWMWAYQASKDMK